MITLIAAISENYVIGKDNKLPWFCSADLQRFKKLTDGKTVLMGRNTWDSLPNMKLPNRETVVVTTRSFPELSVRPDKVVQDLDCFDVDDFWVVGGSSLYERYLPIANIVHLTIIKQTVEGDTYFPAIDFWNFDIKEVEDTDQYKFLEMTRR